MNWEFLFRDVDLSCHPRMKSALVVPVPRRSEGYLKGVTGIHRTAGGIGDTTNGCHIMGNAAPVGPGDLGALGYIEDSGIKRIILNVHGITAPLWSPRTVDHITGT